MAREREPRPGAVDNESKPAAEGNEARPGMPGSGSDRAGWRAPSWSRSPLLHEWIKSGGILIAAAWGIYTFIWQDILVPSWQPAQLRLEATLTTVPDRPATAAGREMTLVVQASNSSSRRLYPLANIWWLRGINRQPRPGSMVRSSRPFLQESDQALRRQALQHVERDVISSAGELLAVGRLFDDDVIDPGGIVNRTILVRIPINVTAVDLRVVVPVLSRSPKSFFNKQRLAWGLSDLGDPIPLICPATSSMADGSSARCQPFDSETDRMIEQFDPQKATITLNQQIGLP